MLRTPVFWSCALLCLGLIGGEALSQSRRQQPTIRPIDRSMERFERSLKKARKGDQEQLIKAIEEARKAAEQMVLTSGEIKNLARSFAGGEIERSILEKEFKSRTKKLSSLTRPIRVISYLDPSQNHDIEEFEKAEDPSDFAGLTEELNRLSLSVKSRVRSFYGYGISLDRLQEPSLEALTGSISRLTRTLSKSLKEL